MDLSTLVKFCSFTVARQVSEKRKRRAAILRRPLAIERLDGRCLLSGDPLADYQSALADAQALYGSQQATEDATWQSTFQDAQDTLSGQLSDISSGENTFVQGKQQDIANTIAAATTTEQNSEAAADQQAATDDQAADTLAQQQIQQAQTDEANQDATDQAQYDGVAGPALTQLSAAETADKNTFDSTMATDQAQHDSTVNSAEAAVTATQTADESQAGQTDAGIEANLQNQIDDAAAARDATINGATPSVDPDVVTANDPGYQSIVASQTDTFNSTIAGLQDTYNSTTAAADALQQQQLAAASAQLASDQQTAQQDYANNQQAANDAYNQAMAPIQTTLDSTLATDQAGYDSKMQTANDDYSTDMRTAANTQAASQQAADDAYNSAAQPLTDGYNTWLTGRTAQYNTDIQAVQDNLNSQIASEENSYNTKVAGYAATLQSDTQAAIDAYNNGVAPLAAKQASDDQAAWDTYNSNVAGAQQTLDDAQNTYSDTVNQIYQDAEQNGTNPDQSALDAAYATLEAANHAYTNATAGSAVTLQSSLGDDENAFVTGEGPLYVTEQDAIATAQGNYDTSVASADHTTNDNEDQDEADADGQTQTIAAVYDNDVEAKYEALQLALAPLVKTREDAYADAAQQYEDDSLTAWAALMNAQNDATQAQAKADTDAYGGYDLAADVPWQTLQEQLAQADADLADALAKANTTYNTSVTAADVQAAEAYVAAAVAYDTGVEGAENDYINTVAPAWAASIIAASGNDTGTTTWANAWSAYMIAAVSDTENSESQEDSVFQNMDDEVLALWPGLSAQVSAADKTLADQAGAAEVTQVTNDTDAILACDAVTVPAQVALTKGQIDDAHDEVAAEIKADKQDGNTHASDEDTRAKAYSAAQLAALQQEDPVIASDDEAERTRMASDGSQGDQDIAAANKTVNAATETEVDNLVPDGQTMVDSEAKANKDYVKAEVKQAVDDANAQAASTQNTIAAEPDTDFPVGETIGVPGIYILIDGVNATFVLPMIGGDGQVLGYRAFWFSILGKPDGLFGQSTAALGFWEGKVSMVEKGPTFNPESYFDYFVPTSYEGLMNMVRYAMNARRQQGMNYSFAMAQTGLGFLINTMVQGGVYSKYAWNQLTGAKTLQSYIEALPGTIELPTGEALYTELAQ